MEKTTQETAANPKATYQLPTEAEMRKDMEKAYNAITMKNTAGKTIKIYQMVHVAPKFFYENVEKSLREDLEKGYTVHLEGVKANRKKTPQEKDIMQAYAKLADLINRQMSKCKHHGGSHEQCTNNFFPIMRQPKFLGFQGTNTDNVASYDISMDNMTKLSKIRLASAAFVINTAMDNMADEKNGEKFEETKEEFLKFFIEDMLRKGTIKGEKPKGIASKVFAAFFSMESLHTKRNDIAIGAALAEKRNVSLVWGKAHAPEFVRILGEAGYKAVK